MKRVKQVFLALLILNSTGTTPAQTETSKRLSIEDLFDLAETNSKSIRIYKTGAEEAQQAVDVAKNAKLPSIDLSLSFSYLGDGRMTDRNFSNGYNAPMPHYGNNFVIEASQVVYAGGAISKGIEQAELGVQSALLEKENNRQDVRFLLAGHYLEIFKLNNQKEVYRQNIEQTKRLLSDIRAKLNEGLVLKNDITRYELQLKSLELAFIQIENSKTILNNRLVTALDLPQETQIEIDTSIISRIPLVTPEATWQNRAAEISPLIRQAGLGVKQSELNEKIIRAERLPSVSLMAGDRLDGPIIIEVPPIDKNFNYWYVGIGVKYNLASSYKTGKKSRLARLATQKAMESRELLEDNIRTGIKSAHIRFVESFAIYETQLKSLELANQNYQVVRNRYMNDLALITDMLDASHSKLNAALEVANARINILFNYYKLKKATGNL